ncbi:PDZ/DHR/GLGF domain-containing protein [Stenotrophomonas maltophilia]|nr:PDZ/DHR/GLGF domain-containing protein [Stenotrophomonas maltophilia]
MGRGCPMGARDRPGSAMQRMGSIEVTGLTRDLPGTDNGTLALADYGAILGGSALRCFSTGIEYHGHRV